MKSKKGELIFNIGSEDEPELLKMGIAEKINIEQSGQKFKDEFLKDIKSWSCNFTAMVMKAHDPDKPIGFAHEIEIVGNSISFNGTLNENGVRLFEEILGKENAK